MTNNFFPITEILDQQVQDTVQITLNQASTPLDYEVKLAEMQGVMVLLIEVLKRNHPLYNLFQKVVITFGNYEIAPERYENALDDYLTNRVMSDLAG